MSVDSGPFAGRELALRLRPAEWRVTDLTFRFLIDSEEGPLPGVEALDIAPAVLLHPAVPQPDGERMYELLTRHIRRDPGCLVFLCDITDELDLACTTWYRLGIGWHEVIDTLADLTAAGHGPDALRALRHLFLWLVEEEEMARRPMERRRRPIVPEQPVEVVTPEQARRLLAECDGNSASRSEGGSGGLPGSVRDPRFRKLSAPVGRSR